MNQAAPSSAPVIGLIGGIGSGKSTVGRCLATHGCLVSDSDALARQAFLDDTIRQTLRQWWGDDIFNDDGSINRAAVAAIVFKDLNQRERLEALVHPWIEKRRIQQFHDASDDTVAFVIDAPLLLEAGLDTACDAVIFVDTPREIRLQRVAATRGWDDAELARREESQLSLDEKRSRADYVIRNDEDEVVLEARVAAVLEQILQQSQSE